MDITFEALIPGEIYLTLSDVRVLLNKAIPEDDEVRVIPLTVRTRSDDVGLPKLPDDDTLPDSFDIYVSTDSGIPGGAVAIYGTRDHQTGVHTYEVRERLFGVFGRYRQADSPAELSPLWRWSIINVRATDRADNAVTARHIPLSLVAVYVLFGLLVSWRTRRVRT